MQNRKLNWTTKPLKESYKDEDLDFDLQTGDEPQTIDVLTEVEKYKQKFTAYEDGEWVCDVVLRHKNVSAEIDLDAGSPETGLMTIQADIDGEEVSWTFHTHDQLLSDIVAQVRGEPELVDSDDMNQMSRITSEQAMKLLNEVQAQTGRFPDEMRTALKTWFNEISPPDFSKPSVNNFTLWSPPAKRQRTEETPIEDVEMQNRPKM